MTIWRFAALGALGAVLCATIARAQTCEETFGCEANPTGDPVGGGSGYRDIHTTGDFVVRTKAELLGALKEAKAGQVVFVPDCVEIDLSGQRSIRIPGGVTLAGTRGLEGSLGARIFTTLKESYELMRTANDFWWAVATRPRNGFWTDTSCSRHTPVTTATRLSRLPTRGTRIRSSPAPAMARSAAGIAPKARFCSVGARTRVT